MKRALALLPLLALAIAQGVSAQGFPTPPVPSGNPITVEKVLLGKALFWDEQLSSTGTIACGTCHMPEAGSSDPRSVWLQTVHPGPDRDGHRHLRAGLDLRRLALRPG